jgi:hypothetical protein
MANDKSILQPAPVSSVSGNALEIVGYLANNWCTDRPALMLNPEASPGELLAWCWGEVMSVLASADALATCADSISAGDVSAIFLHRLRPIEQVLDYATNAVVREEKLRRGPELAAPGLSGPLRTV